MLAAPEGDEAVGFGQLDPTDRIALPLFTRLGRVVDSRELAEFKGAVFERLRVSKVLAAREPEATP